MFANCYPLFRSTDSRPSVAVLASQMMLLRVVYDCRNLWPQY